MSQYYARESQQGSNISMRVLERNGAPVASSTAYAYPPTNSQHSPLVQNQEEWTYGQQTPNRRITTEATLQPYEISRESVLDDKSPLSKFLPLGVISHIKPSAASSPYIKGLPTTPYQSNSGQPSRHHSEGDPRLIKSYATNLIIICLWVLVAAAVVGLLEGTAHHARDVVKQPWYYDWLPTIALTLFAQAHGPITAAFDTRIAVSTLSTPWAPKTWAELFYTADGKWGSPLGMLTSLWSASFRLSLVFYLFILHTILAIVAPLLLSRAYPFQTISVVQNKSVLLNTFYPPSMSEVEFDLQIAIGSGALATGLSILNIYNSSAYVPVASSRNSMPSEMFFAGDSQQTDTVLDGLHIQGSCERVQGLSDPISEDTFVTMCNTLVVPVNDDGPIWQGFVNQVADSTNLTIGACSSKPPFNTNWMDNSTSSFATGYMWILGSNSTTSNVSGVAMCNASFTTARAQVYGREGTFDALEPTAVYNGSLATGANPLAHPLTAALVGLQNPPLSYPDNKPYLSSIAVFRMFGYSSGVGTDNYNQPTIDEMIGQIWAGALFMTSSIAIVSQKELAHDAVAHALVSGRVRQTVWADAACAVLALWFLLLVFLAVGLFRPAVGDGMSAYVAGRLLAEHPELVRGKEYGTLGDNENMQRAFS
ncbi:hypothetical protein HWV62_14730 [Athelia sp. TMB]|nr:hypothetical protein HWV62_14730 [Athelia sp. TMB]